MFNFSYSFQTIVAEARDILIKPVSFWQNLPKTPETILSLYFRFLTFLGFFYISAVLGMTLFTPTGVSAPPISFLFFEIPIVYFLASLIAFPVLGFCYMFISWACGGVTNWERSFRASTAIFSTFWIGAILQSFGGLIHLYAGIGIGTAFIFYIPFLFFLALTLYLEAPVKRTAIILCVFFAFLFYIQYSRMSSYIKDYKLMESMNSKKTETSREEEQKGENEAAEIIRKAMEKAQSEGKK
ncbi:Yip1 family protein [Leptospira sp. WS92.C1]